MDSITHTLFGLAIYESFKIKNESKQYNRALLVTSISASQIPDIDVISKLWDTEGLYQMWHRGITHSLVLTPVWSLLFFLLAWSLFKIKDMRIFYISWLAVFIHDTSDLFNAWGTGYFEPFSTVRITFGTVPIVDFVFWIIIIGAFGLKKWAKMNGRFVFKIAWMLIVFHVVVQSTQGYFIYNQYKTDYDQVALSADFVPSKFKVIGKKDGVVNVIDAHVIMNDKLQYTLPSSEDADLDLLFTERPRARTLFEWSPFVVIVDDDQMLGIYDPRFYRNGQSFLFEYIEKVN
ncbi:metal-dependent hydrolase [Calidifontibacillus oryziterrae]|uniref:metal-dependent hydrolase n=1 Tax=Calidifontibacillus oryziterrae TaxID=1191699 RepID=UPI0002EC5033|nr:metal-dependent hydrolase [Calidifontibacillus oryziterrae]